MSDGHDEIQHKSEMLTIWQLIGVMSLDGRLTLDETRLLTESLAVWTSYVRNKGNKTWTARELGKSRRLIRSIVRRWEGSSGDRRALPLSLRRWVLGEGRLPTAGTSTRALQADVEHELRMSRGEALPESGSRLPALSPAPLRLPAAKTIDVSANEVRPDEDHSAVGRTETGDPVS